MPMHIYSVEVGTAASDTQMTGCSKVLRLPA